jgi:ribose-phosphate pyrophosphokinase
MSNGRDNILFSGSANPLLASQIVKGLRTADSATWKLGNADVKKFSDGETAVRLWTHIRDKDIFLFQSICNPANDNLMELLTLADATNRSAANSITAIIPYYGYARQDRRPNYDRVPITARLVADLLQTSGIEQIITCDLHCMQIQGFFNRPVVNVSAIPTFQADIWQRFDGGKEIVIVSPDTGGVARARSLGKALENTNLAIIDKRRPKANVSEVMNIIGDVDGRECIIFDDLVDTAGTLCKAAAALKGEGATRVHAYATHAVLSGNALDNIQTSELDSLTVTDTIPLNEAAREINKIRVVSIAELLTETVYRVSTGNSVSALYDMV